MRARLAQKWKQGWCRGEYKVSAVVGARSVHWCKQGWNSSENKFGALLRATLAQ